MSGIYNPHTGKTGINQRESTFFLLQPLYSWDPLPFPNWSYGIYVNVESVLFVNNKCWEEVANISLAGEDDGRFAFTWQFPQCRWASTTYPQTHEPQVERKMPLSGDPCRDVHPPIHDDANDRAPPQIVVIRIIMARSSR